MKTKITMLKAILKKLKGLVSTTKSILRRLLRVEKPVGNNMATWLTMGWHDWYLLDTEEFTDWLTWTATNITSTFYTSDTQTARGWTYQVQSNSRVWLPDYAENWRSVEITSHNTAQDEYWNSYSLVVTPEWGYSWQRDNITGTAERVFYSLQSDAVRSAFGGFSINTVSQLVPKNRENEKLRNFMKLVVWEITVEEHNKIEKQICGEKNPNWSYYPLSDFD